MASPPNVLEAVMMLVEATREQTATMRELAETIKDSMKTVKEFTEEMKEQKETTKRLLEVSRSTEREIKTDSTPEVIVLSDDSTPPSPKRQNDESRCSSLPQYTEPFVQPSVSNQTHTLKSSQSSSFGRGCCVFCAQDHRSHDCTNFVRLQDRMREIFNRNLCLTCGSSRDNCNPCKHSSTTCTLCNIGRHWEPLCPALELQFSRQNN